MSDHRDDPIDPYRMTCAELVELVTDYVEGDLPAEDRARIDAHLSVCPPCIRVIDQWRAVIELTGHLEEEHADLLPATHRARLMEAFRNASPPS